MEAGEILARLSTARPRRGAIKSPLAAVMRILKLILSIILLMICCGGIFLLAR